MLAADVQEQSQSVAAKVSAAAAAVASPVKQAATPSPSPAAATTRPAAAVSASGVYEDFQLGDQSQAVAQRLSAAKLTIPHYYLSMEINLQKLMAVRQQLNAGNKDSASQLSVFDFMIKAIALASKQVPDVNASWRDTFVRRYNQVDVNVVLGAGASLQAPVIRNVGAKGLSAISQELAAFENSLSSDAAAAGSVGTFTVHNLGMYGVKTAAAIILPPQACALTIGTISDTVVPLEGGNADWQVAPVVTVTLSCDHRVVDGAVGAQWLAAYRAVLENPLAMLL